MGSHDAPESVGSEAGAFHQATEWDVRTSLKYDTLCVLNVLSDDPFYLQYYRESYLQLRELFVEKDLQAFRALKTSIKDSHGGIISAMLTLYYSVVGAESLDDMISVVRDNGEMRSNLQKTPYYSKDSWDTYLEASPHLEESLVAMKRVKFDGYWEKNARPVVEAHVIRFRKLLQEYDIVPKIERLMGRPLESNRVNVHVLYYSEPHGIKLGGTNFITHYSYPIRIVLRNAIHEMMHPPFDLDRDPGVKEAIDYFRADRLLMDKVENHERSFGYNTLEGLVEEDCVQALEQVVAEGLDRGDGLAGNPREYWAQQDGGIHVLAVALYRLMKEEEFSMGGRSFPEFLVDAVQRGRLAETEIEARSKESVT